ncbi:MAG: hypothetical protein ACRDRQ_05635 [Pseudonocardiaceae bacterium]
MQEGRARVQSWGPQIGQDQDVVGVVQSQQSGSGSRQDPVDALQGGGLDEDVLRA